MFIKINKRWVHIDQIKSFETERRDKTYGKISFYDVKGDLIEDQYFGIPTKMSIALVEYRIMEALKNFKETPFDFVDEMINAIVKEWEKGDLNVLKNK